jgi:coproporphyrinogen III oxidase
MTSLKDRFYAYIQTLQDQICAALEAEDGGANSKKTFGIGPEAGADAPASSKTATFSRRAA